MITFAGHTACVRSVQYSPDGAYLASGGEDNTVRLWSLAEQRVVRVWDELPAGVETLAFADEAHIVAGLANGTLLTWQTTHHQAVLQLHVHDMGFKTLLIHGRTIISIGWDQRIMRTPSYSVPHPAVTAVIDQPTCQPTCLALAPNGVWVVYGLTGQAVYQSARLDKSEVFQTPTEVGVLASVIYSSDGHYLAMGSQTGTIRLLDNRVEHSLILRGHQGVVYAVAFTPDNRRLLSTGADATTRVWDVATGRVLHVFQWHQHWTTCLAVAPDGMTIATAGADGIVAVWDMPDE